MSIRKVRYFHKVDSILGPRVESPAEDDHPVEQRKERTVENRLRGLKEQPDLKAAWAELWAKLKAFGERVMESLSGRRK